MEKFAYVLEIDYLCSGKARLKKMRQKNTCNKKMNTYHGCSFLIFGKSLLFVCKNAIHIPYYFFILFA